VRGEPADPYQHLDGVLLPWAARHRLHLSTTYQDSVIRAIHVVGIDGTIVQMWLDPPKEGRVVVNVTINTERDAGAARFAGTDAELESLLDQGLLDAKRRLGTRASPHIFLRRRG
jgi:hypothetical protein